MQHPLFPEHEPNDRELGFIRVWRHEKDGSRFCVPSTFGADELTGIDQLFEAWGGGRYEVVGHEPNGRVLARQRYAFEGPSKPLAGGAEEAPPAAKAAPVPAPGDSGQWGAMMGMMQMFLQMQQQQSQQQTQLVLALMNKGDTNANAHVQSMTQLYSQFGQTQGELLKAALANRAGGADSSEAFVKGLEFAREFMAEGGGQASDDGLESLLESAGQFFAGMQQAKQAAPATAKSDPPQETQS
jgi:hypothetical protein